MAQLLSLMPPLAWILIFLVLLFSVSYLYVKNKNLIKMALGLFFTLALISGGTWGYKLIETTNQAKVG